MLLPDWILATGALCLIAGAAFAAPAPSEQVRTVPKPTTGVRNPFYVSNRAPLAPNPLIKLPIGSIRPEGWLRAQLTRTADGYTGHLTEISRFCKFEGNAWVSPTGQGENGWEEVPYWLKGFGDLGYVLGDKRITAEARKWIEGVLANQAEDGYFGPRTNIAEKTTPTGPMVSEKLDLWPNMPMLNVLESYYEATGDKRVLTFMTKYFRWQLNLPLNDILPGYWDKMRGGDNVQSIYWLYNRTGDKWLLDSAKKVYDSTARWEDRVVNWHGVNITQGFRAPAIYYQQSHDPKHLAATERVYQTVMQKYGEVPGGMFGADENAREGYDDPRQAAETCSMVEFMHSDQLLIGITGDPVLGDRIEEIAFNDFPASQTPDLKGLHYLTAPNQVQLDRQSKSPGIQNGGDMFSYNPHEYRCCQHNVAMGWPYYAENLWMATQDRGLAAILYGASSVTAKVGPGSGTNVTIQQVTNYPFSDRIRFNLATPKTVTFPLMLRIPQWAKGARVAVNGKRQDITPKPSTYLVLERAWKDGDTVDLVLPMSLEVKRWARNKNAATVVRGPLAYSLQIGERWDKYGEEPWPAHEVFPTTPWNYGLVLNAKDPTDGLRVTVKPGPLANQPFTPEDVPIRIAAKGRRIPGWTQVKGGLVDVLQPSPIRSAEPVEDITLIPMGAARLRISAFPVIGTGADAVAWKAPVPDRHTASHENDDINAPSDGIEPKSSGDESIPRFTWWDHRGTREWLTYDLKAPRRVSAVDVYWFDDREQGACRVPASWGLEWKDGDTWRPVSNPSTFGTDRDRYNTVTFNPVTTKELRITVQSRPAMSSGILEWKVRQPHQ